MLSDSESELFITQGSFNGSTSIELSENKFESLFAGADNEKAVYNFSLRTEDLFTHTEDSGRDGSSLSVTEKEIQTRNQERVAQNTKRASSWQLHLKIYSLSKANLNDRGYYVSVSYTHLTLPTKLEV